MEKVQATNLRPGMVVLYNGDPHRVMTFMHRTPGKGNAVVQTKLRNVRSGVQTETRWMSTEFTEKVPVSGRDMDYLYKDTDGYVFMDSETYDQITLHDDMLEAEIPWLEEGMKVSIQYVGDEIMGLTLPGAIEITVEETPPGMKGATATASPKPATLANGVVIKVPQFVESGELIRVDPSENRYLERVR